MARCRLIAGADFPARVTGTPGGVVVGFGSHRCGHCAAVARAVEEAAASAGADVELYTIDTHRDPDLTERWEITASPTLIYFRGGREIGRSTGRFPRSEVQEALNRIAQPAD